MYQLPRMFGDAGAPPAPQADYKISFLPGECLRISNKAVILFPSQRTTRPCRGVGFFSFFVYSPANWFCGIHAPFPPPCPDPLLVLLFSVLILVPRPSDGAGRRVRLFRGTQIRGVRVRGVPVSTRGEKPPALSSAKIILDVRRKPGGFLPIDQRAPMLPCAENTQRFEHLGICRNAWPKPSTIRDEAHRTPGVWTPSGFFPGGIPRQDCFKGTLTRVCARAPRGIVSRYMVFADTLLPDHVNVTYSTWKYEEKLL